MVLALGRSKLRQALLTLFFKNPESSYYLRELGRLLNASPGALARELKTCSTSGLLVREKRKGKEVFYKINRSYPLFHEIKRIIEKTEPVSSLPAGKGPTVYIVAGPNGSGKTTFAKRFLPEYVWCKQFVNADLIAGGLSPFSPEDSALRAGKLLLEQIQSLAQKKISFGFETTLAGKSYQKLLLNLKSKGYGLRLFFLWIPNAELAISRIQDRVKRGGHFIPESVVRRRIERGLSNFFSPYGPLLDSWAFFDNSGPFPNLVAARSSERLEVQNAVLWERIKKQAGVKKYE